MEGVLYAPHERCRPALCTESNFLGMVVLLNRTQCIHNLRRNVPKSGICGEEMCYRIPNASFLFQCVYVEQKC